MNEQVHVNQRVERERSMNEKEGKERRFTRTCCWFESMP